MPLEIQQKWYCPSCKRILTEHQKTKDDQCALCHANVTYGEIIWTMTIPPGTLVRGGPSQREKELEGLLREVLRACRPDKDSITVLGLYMSADLQERIEAALKGEDIGNAEG